MGQKGLPGRLALRTLAIGHSRRRCLKMGQKIITFIMKIFTSYVNKNVQIIGFIWKMWNQFHTESADELSCYWGRFLASFALKFSTLASAIQLTNTAILAGALLGHLKRKKFYYLKILFKFFIKKREKGICQKFKFRNSEKQRWSKT